MLAILLSALLTINIGACRDVSDDHFQEKTCEPTTATAENSETEIKAETMPIDDANVPKV